MDLIFPKVRFSIIKIVRVGRHKKKRSAKNDIKWIVEDPRRTRRGLAWWPSG